METGNFNFSVVSLICLGLVLNLELVRLYFDYYFAIFVFKIIFKIVGRIRNILENKHFVISELITVRAYAEFNQGQKKDSISYPCE